MGGWAALQVSMRICCVASLALAACKVAPSERRVTASDTFCIDGARLFDGERLREGMSVCVRGGVVDQVAAGAALAGAERVDARGCTLLPGLIDAHAHVWDPPQLEQALAFGTTTVLDMGGNPDISRGLRRAGNDSPELAELRFAGRMLTAPGGHGTEYDRDAPTVRGPSEVASFVAERLAEGSDYIKIIYEDGRAFALELPTISRETLVASVEAAHARGALAVVHISSQSAALEAIDAGADGLAHLFSDRAPEPDFAARAAARHAFVVPTLSVLASGTGSPPAEALAREATIRPYLAPAALESLAHHIALHPGQHVDYRFAEAAVRVLRAAGVTLLAGTDAQNPGTSIGVSLHDELQRLVAAGLTPVEAITAATSSPADRFRLPDRGRVAPGKRADLLLVDGDPSTDIRATHDIVAIWKGGKRFDRAAYADRLRRRGQPGEIPGRLGLISDFEPAGTEPSRGWRVIDDRPADGASSATLSSVAGGNAGSRGALHVDASIVPRRRQAWAGAFYPLVSARGDAVDYRAAKAIHFACKGDPRRYQLWVFSRGHGPLPLRHFFDAGPEWKTYRVPFSELNGFDGRDITAIAIVAGPTPGAVAFDVDDVGIE